ncbi:unnamed protein product [Aphanomyces euteiches]
MESPVSQKGEKDGVVEPSKECRHVTAAIDLSKFRKRLKQGGLHHCETCEKKSSKKIKSKSSKMLNDMEKIKEFAVCVACGFVGCLGLNHCTDHLTQKTKHFCYFNMDTKQIWCTKCECIVPGRRDRAQQAIKDVVHAFDEIVIGKSGRLLHAKGDDTTDSEAKDETSESSSSNLEVSPAKQKKDRFSWKVSFRKQSDQPKEDDENGVDLIPGLANLGNTCYFNSTIQSLKSVFLPMLADQSLRLDAKDTPITESLLAFFQTDVKHIKQVKGKSVYSPITLLMAVREQCRQFRNRAQQDAYELFLGMIWAIDDEHIKATKAQQQPPALSPSASSAPTSPPKSPVMQQIFVKDEKNQTTTVMVPANSSVEDIQRLVAKKLQIDDDELLLTGGKPTTPSTSTSSSSFVCRAFLGCLVNSVVCHTCKTTSKAYDDCISVSLSIPNEIPDCSLEDCLDAFTTPTKISEALGSGYNCDKCNAGRGSEPPKLSTATVHMQFYGLAPFLILHLKRLTKAKKISRHVSFSFDLDVSPYVAMDAYGPHLPTTYSLQAVIVHSGGRFGGHYVAYVKHGSDWFHTSDTSVHRVSKDVVLAAEAYMLFYARQNEK